MIYLLVWWENYHNVLLVSCNIELAFYLPNPSVCTVMNNIFHAKIEFKCFGSHADDGEVIQSGIVVENKLSS